MKGNAAQIEEWGGNVSPGYSSCSREGKKDAEECLLSYRYSGMFLSD